MGLGGSCVLSYTRYQHVKTDSVPESPSTSVLECRAVLWDALRTKTHPTPREAPR